MKEMPQRRGLQNSRSAPPTAALPGSSDVVLARQSPPSEVHVAITPPDDDSPQPEPDRVGSPGTRSAPPAGTQPRKASSAYDHPEFGPPEDAVRPPPRKDRSAYLLSGVPPLSDRTNLRRLDPSVWLSPSVDYDKPLLPRQTDAQLRIIRHQETTIIDTRRPQHRGQVWDVVALIVFTPSAFAIALIFLVGPIALTIAHFTNNPVNILAIAGGVAGLAEFTVLRILRATTHRRRPRSD
jgi:hypothetical protein